jgi:hypothetical protein
LVHGDDYVSACTEESLAWLEAELEKAYEIKTQKLGSGPGCKLEGKVQNRILRRTPTGWEVEADLRHAELIIEQLGLENEKGVVTPGVSGAGEEDVEDDTPLVGQAITQYRGAIARCNYMGTDRPDCLFTIKEGCREMSAPTTGSLRRLFRIGRYLKRYPRLVWEFADQAEQAELVVRTDADWAGCRRSRKSTSGGTVSIGTHCIKVWSKTQAVVAKSSAESELYGVVKGACEALGIRTLCHDIGWDLDIRLELDATAAKGILDRQGISKVRHIDVNCLWLQEQAAKKLVPQIHTADLMTKHLSNAVILKHLQNLSLRHVSGRADMAANLHALQPVTQNKLCKIDRRLKTEKADIANEKEFSGAPRGDHWSERGEYGRCVRVHSTPRSTRFDPWQARHGPGRKTRLRPSRRTIGVFVGGETFDVTDDWRGRDSNDCDLPRGWTGRGIFLVDRDYTRESGTDQRRQREAAPNAKGRARVSWADECDEDSSV